MLMPTPKEPPPDFSNVKSGSSSKKPLPDFSDVQSGSSSTAPRAEPKAAAQRTYTVVKGDSLSKIAKQLYGKANDWRRIYEANKDVIENPDLIFPGQVLKIPEA
jgi:nucleoid-associated protein YgaU